MLLHGYPAAALHEPDPPCEVKCHLCDSLLDVYKRVTDFRGSHPKDLFDEEGNITGSLEVIKVTVRLSSVLAFRLGKDNTDNGTISDNPALLSIARRRGLAVPTVSGTLPYDLWKDLPIPVRDFLLDAAEVVGADRCPPLNRTPPKDEIKDAVRGMQAASSPFGSRNAGTEQLLAAWKQLRIWEAKDDIHYGKDIERSLSEKPILQLQPLHKRVLGLLEAMIGRRLKSVGSQKGSKPKRVAERWRTAFIHPTSWKKQKKKWVIDVQDLHGHPSHRNRTNRSLKVDQADDKLARVEIEAGWLLHAEARNSLNPAHCRLADLMDDLVTNVEKALGISPNTVRLGNRTAAQQAEAISMIASTTTPARRLLLYFGNLAIDLRNFIEHGLDSPLNGALLIANKEFWTNSPGGDHLIWNKQNAPAGWPRKGELDNISALPPADLLPKNWSRSYESL